MSAENNEIVVFDNKMDARKNKINSTIRLPFPRLNQHVLIASPTEAGKSTVVLNLIRRFLQFKFDRIIFFSRTWDDDLYKDFMYIDDAYVHKDFSYKALEKIINEQKSYQEKKKKPLFTLIIFDDFQDLFKQHSYLEDFLCHCRHWNIACWVLAQYVKAISKLSRQQFSGLLCFPSLANEEDIQIIAESAPMGKGVFKKACNIVNDYIKETGKIHTFLWINKKLKDKYWLNFSTPLDV